MNICDGVSQVIGFSKVKGTILPLLLLVIDLIVPLTKILQADRTGMSLLCMPIFDKNGQSIGVAQMINKMNGFAFTQTDVESFEVCLQIIIFLKQMCVCVTFHRFINRCLPLSAASASTM